MSLEKVFIEGKKLNNQIRNAVNNRKLIMFLGAGVSRLMGVCGWDELANGLIKEAYDKIIEQEEIIKNISSSKEKITIAYNKFVQDGRKESFFIKLHEKLNSTKDCEENIYSILARFRALYITTNADSLFENILGEESCHKKLDENFEYDNGKFIPNQLFYLHGKSTLQSTKEDLVFTVGSYIKKYNDQTTITFLKKIFSNPDYTIVFIGYGLNEYELIDYIYNKINYTDYNKKNLFCLEGFFSNQDYLYGARKEYFDSMGIQLIPYNKDINGYKELYNVLNSWCQDINEKTLMPANIYDDIVRYKEFSENNAKQICNLLKVNEEYDYVENKIAEELMCSKDIVKWVHYFKQEGFYNFSNFCLHINNSRCWNLFNLLLKSNDPILGNVVNDIIFNLESCDNKDIFDSFDNKGYYILNQIVQGIFNMESKYINDNIIDFLKKIIEILGLEIFAGEEINLSSIFEWEHKFFVEFLKLLFGKMEVYLKDDIQYYYLEEIAKILNNNKDEKRNEILFSIILECLINYINAQNKFNHFIRLKHINNLDNIYKTYYKGLQIILDIIRNSFLKIEKETQEKKVMELISKQNTIFKKLGIYLLRKSNNYEGCLLEYVFNNCYDSSECHCELYIFLSDIISKISNNVKNELIDLFKSKFDNINLENKYILNLQATFLNLLSEKETKKLIKEKGAEIINFIGNADKTDYVQILTVKSNDKFVELDNTNKNHFIKDIKKHSDNMFISLSKSIINSLKKIKTQVFNAVLNKLKKDKDDYCLIEIIKAVRYYKDEVSEENKEIIGKFCLRLINSFDKNKQNDDIIINAVELVVNLDIYKINMQMTYKALKKVFNYDFDKAKEKNYTNSIITNNYIVAKLLILYVLERNIEGQILKKDKDLLIKYVSCNLYRYELCNFFNTIWSIFCQNNYDSNLLINNLLKDGAKTNINALLIVTENIKHVIKEVVDLIKKIDKREINNLGKENNYVTPLYNYICYAHFYENLDIKEWLNYPDFVICIINVIQSNANLKLKDFIIEYWEILSSHIKTNIYICNSLIRNVDLIKDNDIDSGIIDKYLDLIKSCNNNALFNINIKSYFAFLDINFDKANEIITNIFKKRYRNKDQEYKDLSEKYMEIGRKQELIDILNCCLINNKIHINLYHDLLAK